MTRSCLLVVLLTATVVSAHATETREDRVDRFLKAAMSQMRIPGLSVVVLKGGTVVKSAAYGLANVECEVASKPDTLYLLASITKVFTATLVMMLVEEGKVLLCFAGRHGIK